MFFNNSISIEVASTGFDIYHSWAYQHMSACRLVFGFLFLVQVQSWVPELPVSESSFNLVICDRYQEDLQNMAQNSVLMESHCVHIDVCTASNHRMQTILPQTWHHRSSGPLMFDSEIGMNTSVDAPFSHHNIEYARIPEGVNLVTCAPDFEIVRKQGRYECNNNTLLNVSGVCPSASYTAEDCMRLVQYDAVNATTPSLYGTTQMIYYEFAPGWGCHTNADLTENGITLSQTKPPNQLVPCGALDHGTWSQISVGCVPNCDTGYVASGESCVPACGSVTLEACPTGQYALAICTNMSTPRYECGHCEAVDGKEFKPWSAANPTLCDYTDCLAGHYDDNSVCTSCPVNTISTAALSTFCQECTEGKYQPATGQTACLDCFSTDVAESSAGCPDGYELHRSVQTINDFFSNITLDVAHLKNMTQYCFDNYACLPCKPGSYEVSHVCEACPLGTYQHNWAASACFACATGQSTMQIGSESETACVCQPGFE